MGNRRKAREAILQILFQVDLAKMNAEQVLHLFWKIHPAVPEIEAFASQIVRGVLQHQAEIDQRVEAHSTHWKLARMACVDRNILRMAVYEFMYCPDIPSSVTLNEAIDLGKKYGTEESGAFINGVLDHISKEMKP